MHRRTVTMGLALAGLGTIAAETAAQSRVENPLIAAFAKTLSSHDINAFAALFADDYVNHQVSAAAPKPTAGETARYCRILCCAVERNARPFGRDRSLARQRRYGCSQLCLYGNP